MKRRHASLTCLAATTALIALTGSLEGCSSSSSTSTTATAAKAPVKTDKIQGRVQLQLQSAPSEAALNSGGPTVFLWEGVRRYRLFFKTRMDDVNPGEKYVAEGIWAQRVIDELGDPDQGKNGYPLEKSCEHVVKMAWPGQSFDLTDAEVSTLRAAIKRYPARPLFLVTKFTPLEGGAKEPDDDKLTQITVPPDKQKAALVEGNLVQPAPLWAPEGGTAKCKVVIGKDGKIAELDSGSQLCEAMPWEQVKYQPPVQGGKPVKIATEVEVRFEPKK